MEAVSEITSGILAWAAEGLSGAAAPLFGALVGGAISIMTTTWFEARRDRKVNAVAVAELVAFAQRTGTLIQRSIDHFHTTLESGIKNGAEPPNYWKHYNGIIGFDPVPERCSNAVDALLVSSYETEIIQKVGTVLRRCTSIAATIEELNRLYSELMGECGVGAQIRRDEGTEILDLKINSKQHPNAPRIIHSMNHLLSTLRDDLAKAAVDQDLLAELIFKATKKNQKEWGIVMPYRLMPVNTRQLDPPEDDPGEGPETAPSS